jgi:hypothetical protein
MAVSPVSIVVRVNPSNIASPPWVPGGCAGERARSRHRACACPHVMRDESNPSPSSGLCPGPGHGAPVREPARARGLPPTAMPSGSPLEARSGGTALTGVTEVLPPERAMAMDGRGGLRVLVAQGGCGPDHAARDTALTLPVRSGSDATIRSKLDFIHSMIEQRQQTTCDVACREHF